MRKISKEELSEILKQHTIWLESNYTLGSRANLSYTNLEGADLSHTDLSGADLSGANLSYANLEGANLYKANLSGDNLSIANLSYANLSHTDLSGADLSGANLYGVDLSNTKGTSTFRYGKHLAVAFKSNKYIKIGCKTYRTGNWVNNFEKIGKDENYSVTQIKRYGQFINMINEELQGGKGNE